jgi:hypothetical protein
MGAIYAALRDYFASSGLDLDEHPDDGWVATDGFGANGSWLLVGQAHEHLDCACVYCVLPDRVPEPRRDAVAMLLTRINYGLVIGNFELDLDDGEVRFKASATAPTREQLKALVAVALGQTDKWVPAVRAVAAGEAPETVFARILA